MERRKFLNSITLAGIALAFAPAVLSRVAKDDAVGENFSTFKLIFGQKFDQRDMIVGPNGILIDFIGEPRADGNGNFVYECRIVTNDPDAYLVIEDIEEPIEIAGYCKL